MRILEATVFVTLAGALHLAALTLPELPGAGTGGASGADSVTLQAAPDSLAALAERWETPPETAPVSAMAAVSETDLPPLPVAGMPAPARPQAPGMPAPQEMRPEPEIAALSPAPATLNATAPDAPLTLAAPGRDASPVGREFDMPVRPAAPRPPVSAALPQPAGPDTAPAQPGEAPLTSLRPRTRPAQPATAQAPAPRSDTSRSAPAASAPRAAQRAKGSGNSGGAAQTVAPAKPRAGPSQSQLRSAQAQWGGAIRQSVARAQRYPRGTTARGVVTLRISVSPSGRLTGASITGSSGTAALDRAALAAARTARLPRAPKELTGASYSFNLPLQFARR
ncbi:TonB family protein [Puniceibacterium confluentis]|uniref:TonB family protein n=1 Tax=Puniceibacterium confluentis TaxID=1958944 RepID=UPI0011B6C500|nr:TonB family protein [Puniceibacterium confluentis]